MNLRHRLALCALAIAASAHAADDMTPAAAPPGAPPAAAATPAPTPAPTPDPAVIAAMDKGTTVTLATVNGAVISAREFNIAIEALIKNRVGRLMEAGQPVNESTVQVIQHVLREKLLENMIDKRLFQEAVKPFIAKVPEAEIDKEYARTEKRAEARGQKLDELLKANNTSKEELRDQMRKQLASNDFIKSTGANINPDPAEVEKHLVGQKDRVHLAQILIRKSDVPAPDEPKGGLHGMELARSLAKRARDGEDFAKLADEYSQDPSKKPGGDLPELGRDSVGDDDFDNAVFKIKAGEISDAFETKYGFHVVKMISRRELTAEETAQTKQNIIDRIQEQKMLPEVMPGVLKKLREGAKIEYVTPVASLPEVKIDLPTGMAGGGTEGGAPQDDTVGPPAPAK